MQDDATVDSEGLSDDDDTEEITEQDVASVDDVLGKSAEVDDNAGLAEELDDDEDTEEVTVPGAVEDETGRFGPVPDKPSPPE